jgi:arylsulfatase A-like enzyme
VNALYDAEILYMDEQIGRLLKGLRSAGLYDDSWILVTADHGELLGEHGQMGHGNHLFEEVIHVPLFLKYPRGEAAPTRTDERVQLTDLLPLICRRLGLGAPEGIQGQPPPGVTHPILSESYVLPQLSPEGDWRTLREGDWKLHWNSFGHHRLYDVAHDPRESTDLASKQPQQITAMTARLDAYLGSLPPPGAPAAAQPLDPETMKALKSLGSVE